MQQILDDIKMIYSLLSDQQSREVWMNKMLFNETGDFTFWSAVVDRWFSGTNGILNWIKTLPKDKQIVLYGAGRDGKQVLCFFRNDKRFYGFCSSTEEKQRDGYLGYPVISPAELLASKKYSVVIATRSCQDEIYNFLIGSGYPMDSIYDISQLVSYDKSQYFVDGIIKFEEEEVFVDAGCYDLSTSIEMRNLCPNLKKVYAFEPDSQNYRRCMNMKAEHKFDCAHIYPYATWSENAKLTFEEKGNAASKIGKGDGAIRNTQISAIPINDVVDSEERVTYIKMDVEGAELESLKGVTKTITKYKPKLAICLYHNPEDMFSIPLYINHIVPQYKLFVRQHMSLSEETVLYAVLQDELK